MATPASDYQMRSVLTEDDLLTHCGHSIVIARYGGGADFALECEDCCVVLADCEHRDAAP